MAKKEDLSGISQEMASNPVFQELLADEGINVNVPGLKEEPEPEPEPPVPDHPAQLPQSEEPPAPQPREDEAPPPEPPVQEGKYSLTEMFGGKYKSVAEAEAAVAEADSLRGVRDRLESEKMDLKQQLEDQQNPFVNEQLRKFNEFAKETEIYDMNVFQAIDGQDVSEMNDMDVLAIETIIEAPELSNDMALLKKALEKKYSLGRYAMKDEDDEPIEDPADQANLRIDAAKGRKKLAGLKEQLSKITAAPDPVDSAQKEADLRHQWEPVIDEMAVYFQKIPAEIDGMSDPIAWYEFTEAEKTEVRGMIDKYLVGGRMPVNKESMMSAFRTIHELLQGKYRKRLNHLIAEQSRSLASEDYRKKYHNPSGMKDGDHIPEATQETGKKTHEEVKDDAFEKVMDFIGGK